MNYVLEINKVSKGFKIHHIKRNSVFDRLSGILKRKEQIEFLPVLKDISFSVKKGETLGIIGRNGAGKTTLLKLISKIYQPDRGQISTIGSIVPLLQLGIGFHPELNPIDNIITYGILLGYKPSEIKSSISKILKYAELENFSDVKIKNFSSGMFARLAFSTAITFNPDILILDEILSVGDIFFKQKCVTSIKELIKSDKTVLLVSHDPKILLDLCDRIMILKNGQIDMIGEPSETIAHYLKDISSEKDLDSNQSIGSNNYRAYMGQPGKYDIISANQFNLLTLLGLREDNFLLDIGCGSLMGGRLFIPYLLPKRYFGIEPRRWLVKDGIKYNLGNEIIKIKEPQFNFNPNFNFGVFNTKFDYILAESIFSHTSQDQLKKCISEVKKVMKKKTLLVAAYFEGQENYSGEDWVYPEKISYRSEFVKSIIQENGLSFIPLRWRHPSNQKWFFAGFPDYVDKIKIFEN